jgi:uncharacterized low-complexity protein
MKNLSWAAVTAATALALTASAQTVLLDEEWAADMNPMKLVVTVVDTAAGGAAGDVHDGAKSAKIENGEGAGWPMVRFQKGARLKLSDVATGSDRIAFWYRTPAWNGHLQVAVWLWDGSKLAKVLTAQPAEPLTADDQWHQATAVIEPGPDYETTGKDAAGPTYVHLSPVKPSPWGLFVLYLDKVEVVKGEAAPAAPAAAE